MKKLKPSPPLLLLACLAVLSPLAGVHAQDSPLAAQETQARQLAIRILRSIQPIEGWIETTAIGGSEHGSAGRLVEITGSRVNLRAGPSTDSEVSGVGQQGEYYEYIKTEGEWHLIRLDEEHEAYVS